MLPALVDGLQEGQVTRGVDGGRLRMVNAAAYSADSLNALLAVSDGEYVLPLAQGALLRPHALLELALTAERIPSAELIYTDEDRIDPAGQRAERDIPHRRGRCVL